MLEPVIQKKKKSQVMDTESSDSEYEASEAESEEEEMADRIESEEEEILKEKLPVKSKQARVTSVNDSESEAYDDND